MLTAIEQIEVKTSVNDEDQCIQIFVDFIDNPEVKIEVKIEE